MTSYVIMFSPEIMGWGGGVDWAGEYVQAA